MFQRGTIYWRRFWVGSWFELKQIRIPTWIVTLLSVRTSEKSREVMSGYFFQSVVIIDIPYATPGNTCFKICKRLQILRIGHAPKGHLQAVGRIFEKLKFNKKSTVQQVRKKKRVTRNECKNKQNEKSNRSACFYKCSGVRYGNIKIGKRCTVSASRLHRYRKL